MARDAGTYSLHSEDLARAGLPVSAAEVGLQGSNLEDGIHPRLGTLGAKLNWDFNDTVSLTNLLRYTDGEVRFDGIFPGDPPTSRHGVRRRSRRGAELHGASIPAPPMPPTQLVQNHGHWVVNKEYDAIQDDLRLNFKLDATRSDASACTSPTIRWRIAGASAICC